MKKYKIFANDFEREISKKFQDLRYNTRILRFKISNNEKRIRIGSFLGSIQFL